MADNADDQKNSKSKILPRWLNGSINDSIKAVLVPVLTVLILGLISFLLLLNQTYINISITIPAYRWGFGFVVAIIIVYLLNPKIKQVHRILNFQEVFGLIWKLNWHNKLSGPFCPKCKSHVIQEKGFFQTQMAGAFGITQGIKRQYSYKCSNLTCDFQIALDIPISELITEVTKKLLK